METGCIDERERTAANGWENHWPPLHRRRLGAQDERSAACSARSAALTGKKEWTDRSADSHSASRKGCVDGNRGPSKFDDQGNGGKDPDRGLSFCLRPALRYGERIATTRRRKLMAEGDTTSVVLGTGKTLKIGEETLVIRGGDEPPAVFVDFLTEFRPFNGVVCLAFAQAIIDVGNPPEAAVVSRLRMSLASAQLLHQALSKVIEDALKPPDKSKTN